MNANMALVIICIAALTAIVIMHINSNKNEKK